MTGYRPLQVIQFSALFDGTLKSFEVRERRRPGRPARGTAVAGA